MKKSHQRKQCSRLFGSQTTPKKRKVSGSNDYLIGTHTVECTLDGVAAYIASLQTTPKLDTDAVTLHTETDLAFHLKDREDTKQSFVECLKKRIESFSLEKLPEDRTKFPMPVFSGMTGLGKTRMLEEWKGIFADANVSEPSLGVLVTYGNGHSANMLDELLPIQAGFSWRMLHRLFLENNCAPQ
eukprot:scaffold8313_cov23-Attheya_sp.AAC.1